jgi:serine phosphatase RsbU (regulator of sigma subunit)
MIPGTDYVQSAVKVERDNIVIIYTDGITEANNPAGEMLGA